MAHISFPTVRNLVHALMVVEHDRHPAMVAVLELLADLERAVVEYGVLLKRNQPIKDEGMIIQRKLNRLRVLTHEFQIPTDSTQMYGVTMQAVSELVHEIEQAFNTQLLQERP